MRPARTGGRHREPPPDTCGPLHSGGTPSCRHCVHPEAPHGRNGRFRVFAACPGQSESRPATARAAFIGAARPGGPSASPPDVSTVRSPRRDKGPMSVLRAPGSMPVPTIPFDFSGDNVNVRFVRALRTRGPDHGPPPLRPQPPAFVTSRHGSIRASVRVVYSGVGNAAGWRTFVLFGGHGAIRQKARGRDSTVTADR